MFSNLSASPAIRAAEGPARALHEPLNYLVSSRFGQVSNARVIAN
jgi:hypothetical protein